MEKKINANNIGYKLLQAMGWKEGKSLGKTNEGLLEPIKFDIKDKITNEPNKNYKGKNKKKSKNNFTLSSFKSKLYNSKENQKNIIKENDYIFHNNKNIKKTSIKEKNIQEEKKIKKNLKILINLLYNKYFIEQEQNYLLIKHELKKNIRISRELEFSNSVFEEKNIEYPIEYNLNRFKEIVNKLENLYLYNFEKRKNNIDYSFKMNEYELLDAAIIMNEDIQYDYFNTDFNNNSNYENDIKILMYCFLDLENFLIEKNLMALIDEIQYINNQFESSNYEIENNSYLTNFALKFFELIDKLNYTLENFITKVFFYCDKCSIIFVNYEELTFHMENECEEEYSHDD